MAMRGLKAGSTRRFSIAKLALVVLALGAALAVGTAGGQAATRDDNQPPPPPPTRDHGHGHWFRHACDVPAGPAAACDAEVVTDADGAPLAGGSPPAGAYGPAEFHTGYALPTTAPSLQTIGIVDAYNDPSIEADLALYSSTYGLPACTTANGCFKKVNQTGGTTYPSNNAGWALEIALDVETAHQICQNCTILLVEATSNSLGNLGSAVNEAVALGADVVSNSYGAGEFSGEQTYESAYYNHPGVVITASAGDSGFGVEFPAASQFVTAVGGTSLNLKSDNTYSGESVWSGTGSGCSKYEPKPAWQTDSGCTKRTVADVSADADPNTGAAVYDTQNGGWLQVGGTSLAAPLIAAVYALTGNAGANNSSTPYSNAGSLHDVTSGSNGNCGGSYLCTALAGFDGPTGVGTPNGLAGFGFTAVAPTPDFSLSVTPPSATVNPGGAATYTVTVASSSSFGDPVTLSATGLPGAATASFTPNPPTSNTSTLSVATTSALTPGTYPFTISGTSSPSTLTRSVSATLVVASPVPPPSLTVSPSSVARRGNVTVSWSNVAAPATTDRIDLYVPGGTASLGWFYDSSCNQHAGAKARASGSCNFKMPNSVGTYEFRLSSGSGSTLLATSNTVTTH